MSEKIAVLGAGSWGIAIASLLCENGHDISLWEFNRDDFEHLIANRSLEKKLPGIKIDDRILITNNLSEAISDCQLIVLVTPAQVTRKVCENLASICNEYHQFINLAKGVEVDSLKRMSEVIIETITFANSTNVATLSGPSHAEEVARKVPTSVVIASENNAYAERLQKIFNADFFRVYRSEDLIGVELGGALKNVIAIGSGILQGLGFGDNTSGALLTRGLAEISRVGVKMGADPLTFSGLSGVGDLITTCLSKHSRNRYVGEKIGQGQTLKQVLDDMVMVAEGVATCRSAYALSQQLDVEMPIAREVYKTLFEDKPPKEAVADLMGRSLKEEIWG